MPAMASTAMNVIWKLASNSVCGLSRSKTSAAIPAALSGARESR